jgi:hypothetical protein
MHSKITFFAIIVGFDPDISGNQQDFARWLRLSKPPSEADVTLIANHC